MIVCIIAIRDLFELVIIMRLNCKTDVMEETVFLCSVMNSYHKEVVVFIIIFLSQTSKVSVFTSISLLSLDFGDKKIKNRHVTTYTYVCADDMRKCMVRTFTTNRRITNYELFV